MEVKGDATISAGVIESLSCVPSDEMIYVVFIMVQCSTMALIPFAGIDLIPVIIG